MTTTRVLAGLVSNGNVLADGVITPAEIGVLSISSVTYPGDDQAANPAGGQTITVNGAGFASTPTVYVNGVIAPSVSFISSTQITFTSPARSAGTYDIYVVNPSGSTAIRVYGISYSGTPTWTTAAGELGPVDANFTIQLAATGDAPLTYALTSGSTLPSGVTLSSGGLITGSALTVEQTFNFSVDAIDAQSQETPRSFSVSVSLADPYFRYVTMLLSGDTAVMPFDSDASTNNFNIAINGDVRSNNFNPYQAGYYSNYFNGSSYLQTSATQVIPTGSFTVECWAYLTSTSNQGIVAQGTTGNSARFSISVDGGLWWVQIGEAIINTAVPATNVWLYLAATFNGSTLTFYVNGTSIGSVATTNSAQNTTFAVGSLGSGWAAGSYYTTGYVSNVRVSNVVRTITTPTTPYTSDANTRFLSCQSNRFIDNSTNAFALTVSGSPQVAPVQPFTLPSNVATYGSGYFDGTGDYLSTPSTGQFAPSGDFTISCWYYPTSTRAYQQIIGNFNGSASTVWIFEITSGTGISFYTNGITSRISGSGIVVNAWNYLVLARAGSTITGYLNGVSLGTYSQSGTFGSATQAISIGRGGSSTGSGDTALGYIADVKLIDGSAVATVPTTPQTATTGTQLLSLQYNGGANNSGFKDSSQNNFVVTRAGNTTQGTFSPYGSNWSNYFDGSGDYLRVPTGYLTSIGTGNFTVEGWWNPNNFNTTTYFARLWSFGTGLANDVTLNLDTSGNLIFRINDTVLCGQTSGAMSVNTWNHIALVRSSNVITIYLNGSSVASVSNTTNISTQATNPFYIGCESDGAGGYFSGYISNVRITNTAVYTAAFTPSTLPLTAVSGTSLLTCQSNRFKDNSTTNATITKFGDTSVQRFSPFANATAYNPATLGGSAYFDGSGDFLSTITTPANFGANNFTAEGWFWFTTNSGGYKPVISNAGSADQQGWIIITEVDNTLTALASSGSSWAYNITTSYVPPINCWTHIAYVRNGSTLTLYANGVSVGSTSSISTNSIGTASNAFYAGYYPHFPGGPRSFNGYISNVRLVNGAAVYTSAFTPPTAPLTPTANTSLLLSNTNSGVVDSSMMNDLETIGNAQISTSVKKYGTGAVYLDGTNSIVTTVNKTPLGQGTGDFTIEFWFRPATIKLQTILSMLSTTTSANPHIFMDASGYVNYYTAGSTRISGSVTLVANTWYFVTVCRANGTTRLFINGVQSGSNYSDSNNYFSAAYVNIGQYMSSAGVFYTNEWCHGYFDDVRLSNYARYTANFTPPTAAFKLK